jgi:hypothetical protein
MTTPEREPQETPDLQPLPGEVERERADISVVSILAVLAVIVVAGLWFFTKDREMVASDGTVVKQTTGSSPEQPALPARPEPPHVPAQMQASPPAPGPAQQ